MFLVVLSQLVVVLMLLLTVELRLWGLRFGQLSELKPVLTFLAVKLCPPPQLPLLIILSLVLELDTGFRQELLIDAA
jgi:hypothetical protein